MITSRAGRDGCLILAAVDRITSEDVSYVIEALLAAGARNVNLLPTIGKKGRASFLAFIDTPSDCYAPVAEVIVEQLRCTGWHILSSRHEYAAATARNCDVRYRVNGVELELSVPIKVVVGAHDRPIVFLEHDFCLDLYRRHIDKVVSGMSLNDLKNELLHQIHHTIRKESDREFKG